MLREAEFAYAPNEALTQPRHPMFDLPAAAVSLDDAQTQDEEASTPTSVTGWLLHLTPLPIVYVAAPHIPCQQQPQALETTCHTHCLTHALHKPPLLWFQVTCRALDLLMNPQFWLS